MVVYCCALCVLVVPRYVEDGVVQLQETDKDVEGLEEEAVCFTDVLIFSVNQEPVLSLELLAEQSTSIL